MAKKPPTMVFNNVENIEAPETDWPWKLHVTEWKKAALFTALFDAFCARV